MVLQLDLSLQDVGGGPGLGEDDTVLAIDVLGLDVSNNGVRLGIASSGDLEVDIVGSGGLKENSERQQGWTSENGSVSLAALCAYTRAVLPSTCSRMKEKKHVLPPPPLRKRTKHV